MFIHVQRVHDINPGRSVWGVSYGSVLDSVWFNIINLLACQSDWKMILSWTGKLTGEMVKPGLWANKTLKRDKYQVLHMWSNNNTITHSGWWKMGLTVVHA